MFLKTFALISGLAFLNYGSKILSREQFRAEFERYGLQKFQTLVGVAELLGGLAVLAGLQFSLLGVLGSAGLATLMAMGLYVRIRLKDPIRLLVPAATLAAINVVLVALFFNS